GHGDGRGDHEERSRLRPFSRGHPVGQIVDHAREEARLGQAEQHAHRVEAPHPLHEDHAHRHEAPDDHDARDPDPRADLPQDHVAGDLEEEVAEKEEPGAAAEDVLAQEQVLLQVLRREADVDAVDVGHDVAEEDEGDQPPQHLPDRAAAEVVRGVRHLASTHFTLWSPVTAMASAGEWILNQDQGPGIQGYFAITRSSTSMPRPGPFGTVSIPFRISSGVARISSASGKGYIPLRPEFAWQGNSSHSTTRSGKQM